MPILAEATIIMVIEGVNGYFDSQNRYRFEELKTLKELIFQHRTDLICYRSPVAAAGRFLLDIPPVEIPARGCGASKSILCYVL